MIARMARIEVVFPVAALDEVVALLQEQGVLHVEEVPLAVEGAPGLLRRVHLDDAETVRVETLDELDRMLHEIEPLLVVKPSPGEVQAATEQLDDDDAKWVRKARRWNREIRSLARRERNIQDNIEVLGNYHKTLSRLALLLGEDDVTLGRGARAVIIQGDIAWAGRHLENRLNKSIGPECRFVRERTARNTLAGIIVYPEAKDAAVEQILADEGITPLDLPDKELHGIPLKQVLERVDSDMERYRRGIAEIRQLLREFSERTGAQLTAMRLAVGDRRARLRVKELLACSDFSGVIHGWAPADTVAGLRDVLDEETGREASLVVLPIGPIERSRIPTLLHNAKPLEPFEVLLTLLKPPTYGGIDPSALVGIFFVFFYGFILGDVAYGATVLLLAYLVRRRWGRNKLVHGAATVGMYAGVSAIVFGVLFGEFCGNLGEQLFDMKPIWFHRGHDTITLLMAAVIIGVVHVTLSLLIAMVTHFRAGRINDGLEKVGMLLGLAAAGIGAVGFLTSFDGKLALIIAISLLTACIALLVRATGLKAAFHLLEIISLVGNVLSYARLMALGIASVALADIANRIAEMMPSPLYGIPAAFAVHLLNLTIGVFSPTLHALRLNYVEFLPKFYAPEGRTYQPFRKEILS